MCADTSDTSSVAGGLCLVFEEEQKNKNPNDAAGPVYFLTVVSHTMRYYRRDVSFFRFPNC